MATPNEKLAASLAILKNLQDRGIIVLEASAHPELTRTHRERLVKAGFLQMAIGGWYLSNNPSEDTGDSTQWYAHMEAFVAAYANSRFGKEWQVPPELSLLKQSGHTGVLKQIQIHAPKANNQVINLPHGFSVFLYRVQAESLSADTVESSSGLRLLPLEEALVKVGPTFFTLHPLAAQIILRRLDAPTLIGLLLEGGNSVVAGRLAGALVAVGREDDAGQLVDAMIAAAYKVAPRNPFEAPLVNIEGRLGESPYVQRIRAMWFSMREVVIAKFDTVPHHEIGNIDQIIRDIEARYVADAYHSLSIEGYRVTDELIQRVMQGDWSPLTNPQDQNIRDALATKGYFETHKKVVDLIRESLASGQFSGVLLKKHFSRWHLALFSPSVAAGILKPADLAGYRNSQVFIRNALHVPPSPEAVRDCMPALMELIANEAHAGVRAVLGHFVFVFIHPYMDGNGRLGRFLMNYLLTTGGYAWTIVTVQSRNEYLSALEQASTYGNMEPFANLIALFLREQTANPIERGSQRL
jgi:hypothetical protein